MLSYGLHFVAQDLLNYKGIYHQNVDEKYMCPKTGSHFRFKDLCQRMEVIRVQRGDKACVQLPASALRQQKPLELNSKQ